MLRLPRLLLSTVSMLCIIGLLLLTGSEYGWMTDFDPGLESTRIKSDGSRALVRTMLLFMGFGASSFAAFIARTKGERLLPLVLSLLTLGAYVFGSA